MRLVEVVMLMGAHCVSPVEHTPMMTDATKVQCAVVIEKDTERGTLTVTPQDALRDPQVVAAVERFRLAPADSAKGGGTKIVPAWAPAGSAPVEIKLPEAKAAPAPIAPPAVDLAGAAAAAAAEPPAEPSVEPQAERSRPAPAAERKVATLSPPPQKRPPAKAKEAKKQPAAVAAKEKSQCKGEAVAKWYRTADGKRKYRCVKPVSDSAPNQLY